MTCSSHARSRHVLSALAADATWQSIVSEAGRRSSWWTSERRWRRTYGRFTPDAGTFANLAFASDTPSQEICRVDVSARRLDDESGSSVACEFETEAGWARVTRFPFDPGLPGLPLATAGATVVRYHPGRRCTLRTTNRDRTVFAKVYTADTGARVFRALVSLRHAAACGELQVAIPEPLSWDAGTRTLWQGALPGRPAVRSCAGRTVPIWRGGWGGQRRR